MGSEGQPQINWLPGTNISGRYEITEIVGRGGMGLVVNGESEGIAALRQLDQ